MSFVVVIPARYQSSRLPGKPLLDLGGKSMIQHVVEAAQASGACDVVVATDDERIEQAVLAFGGKVCMTSAKHESGSDRLAEVCEKLAWPDEQVIVNVQGDEPLMPSEVIDQVAQLLLEDESSSMATLSVPLAADELDDPNAVKVVANSKAQALYFSRSAIPFDRDGELALSSADLSDNASSDKSLLQCYQRHLGIYAYRCGFLKRYVAWPVAPIERLERLEQLRVLWQGESIRIAQALKTPPAGIDTEADLLRVRAEFQ